MGERGGGPCRCHSHTTHRLFSTLLFPQLVSEKDTLTVKKAELLHKRLSTAGGWRGTSCRQPIYTHTHILCIYTYIYISKGSIFTTCNLSEVEGV